MEDADRVKLEQYEAAMKDLLEAQQIDQATYFKYLINIAYDYSRGSAYPAAARLIQSIPESYYENEFMEQIGQDGEFAEVSYQLSKSFVEAGIIDVSSNFKFERPPALA